MAWKSTRRRPERSSNVSVNGLCLLLAIVFGLATLRVQAADEAPTANKPSDAEEGRYTYAKSRFDHDPNGIGKFYLGREIARVMGYQGAPWLERPSREKEERLSLLTAALELKPGMSVADIGAGSGVITILLAEGVGPSGQVYAVDVQDEMLKLLREKLENLAI